MAFGGVLSSSGVWRWRSEGHCRDLRSWGFLRGKSRLWSCPGEWRLSVLVVDMRVQLKAGFRL
jgi:hypothetical protein